MSWIETYEWYFFPAGDTGDEISILTYKNDYGGSDYHWTDRCRSHRWPKAVADSSDARQRPTPGGA